MSSPSGFRNTRRRRNGKHQACEPCRKAKVACDHTLPTCERCIRRNLSAKCVYLDAPMTRTSEERKAKSTISNFNLPAPTPVTGSSASPILSLPSPVSTRSPEDIGIKSGSTAYFGPTAFSSIFNENREKLGGGLIPMSIDAETFAFPIEEFHAQTFLSLANSGCRSCPRTSLGINLLRTLPDHHTCKFLLEWYSEKAHECIFYKSTVMDCANSFWTTYGKQLKEPRRQEALESLSLAICKNGETPANDDELEDYESWRETFSGTNLRWETLGSVFGALTAAILCLPERDAFFCTQQGQRSNRKQFAMEMKAAVQACISLSNHVELINMQMVALLAKNLILQTILSGDTSLVVWRQVGDLVSATTALGLHRDSDLHQSTSFVSEWRRRIFVVVFNIDKGGSVLTGRPPALSTRYCHVKLPLDVSEDILMKGGAELTAAVAKLDPDGWNREGKVYPVTTTRASTFLSIVLNEILEVTLGEFEDSTKDKIKNLLDRLEHTYASFPAFVRWDPSLVHANIREDILLRLMTVRLDMLEHKLLLERLAYKHDLSDGQSMVNCAREMLELVVMMWVQRDRFVAHHHDYDWMLMCWGVPSAGVLCVELLKQMKSPEANSIQLPRSEIVQNLSLLIGFLEWVRPAAGNYKLCGRMRIVIKRILDRILDPTPIPSQESTTSHNIAQQNPETGIGSMEAFDATLMDPSSSFGDGLDNLDWLDEIDWSRGPWIDLGGQDYSAARWS